MWPNPQETADLVKFTEEILNGKLHFFVVMTFFYFLELFNYFPSFCKRSGGTTWKVYAKITVTPRGFQFSPFYSPGP